MKRQVNWKKIWWWVLGGIFLLLIICLLFGPLFPWGPKIGYVEKQYDKAIVYAKNSSGLENVPDLNVIMRDEETFHRMQYNQKVTIIVTTEEKEWKRFVPYLSYGVGGVSLMRGNVVFINKSKIDSHNYEYSAFFKHELSHNLLYQNSNLVNSYHMFKQSWPMEAIATYYGGPRDYYKNESEFWEAWKKADLQPGDGTKELFAGLEDQGGKFSYTTYRLWMEFLAKEKGISSVQKFIVSYQNNPQALARDFSDSFGISISEAAKEFKASAL